MVAYSIGTIGTLLVLGRFLNDVGRRVAALTSLALLIAGCVVLLKLHVVGESGTVYTVAFATNPREQVITRSSDSQYA